MIGRLVTIKPSRFETLRSGAPIGLLARQGKVGEIIDDSPTYNSSFLVDFGDAVYDIHDEYFQYVD